VWDGHRPGKISPIPVPPPIPDLAGNRRFPPGIGEGIPDSRFGGNRESDPSRIPDSRSVGVDSAGIGKSPGMLIPCEYQARSGGQMLHLILENADFRHPTHVISGCQWLVASSAVRQRCAQIYPQSSDGIPVPPIPDLARAGNRGGNPRFPIRPKSGNGESPIPDSAGT
jgi:hypothetical protein